jgi:putative NADPH-quinone reductase
MGITSLLKKFFERKIALNYRPSEAYETMVEPRVTADFKKKALMIVTANGSDEYRQPMGDPCFEAMEVDFMLEQVETLEQHYIGGMETISEEAFSQKLDMLYQSGSRLVEEIEKAYGNEG